MESALEGFLHFMLIYFIGSSVFRLFALVRAKNAVQELKEQQPAVEPTVPEEIEMVTDSSCGCAIPKAKAYVLALEAEEHYFCSWDCRQKFLSAYQSKKD